MFFYFLFILLIYIHFKIIKATFLIFPLFPSRCVSPLLSLTGAPRGSWSCYPCAKTSGMVTLQRGDTPGKGWKMRNVMFMVGKWKKWKKHMRSASPLTNLVDGPGMALNKGFEVQGCANACAWVTLVKAWVSISNFLKYFP